MVTIINDPITLDGVRYQTTDGIREDTSSRGVDLAGAMIIATYGDGTTESLTWAAFDPYTFGGATGMDIAMSFGFAEHILTTTKLLTSLEVDLTPASSVFDITTTMEGDLDGINTPTSKNGFPFEILSDDEAETGSVTASYSNIVSLTGDPAEGDLFTTIFIDFSGLSASGVLGEIRWNSDIDTLETAGDLSAMALRPVKGTENAEKLLGSAAADHFQAFGGDDTISGGGGADVIFGGDGNDYLYGDGQKITSDPSVSAQVYRLYQATLDREPDTGGHLGWYTRLTENDLTLSDAAAGFVGSVEFQKIYGALDDSAFVNLLYQNVLGRDADAGGLAGWQNALTSGTTRANVVLGFSESAEFINSTREDSTNFMQDNTDTIWADDVYRLYQATLDRAPDLGGFEAWTDRLGSGTEFLSVVTGFVGSPEFQNTYGDLDNTQFVNLLYNNVLDREADARGLSSWTTRLNDGVTREAVVAGFSQSPEFVSTTNGPLAQWVRVQGVDDVLDGGTGSNVLVGGMLSDTFVFDQAQGGTQTVLDLEAWDTIDFRGFGFASAADVRAHFTQSFTSTGPNVIFVDQGVTAMFEGISLGGISNDMIDW